MHEKALGRLSQTDRYVLLYKGQPVYTTPCAQQLIVFLWGESIREAPEAPFDYVLLDYEVPHVLDTSDICGWLARLQAKGAERA